MTIGTKGKSQWKIDTYLGKIMSLFNNTFYKAPFIHPLMQHEPLEESSLRLWSLDRIYVLMDFMQKCTTTALFK